MQDKKLLEIYTTLLNSFGPQDWWPAKTRFEVIVGAILTQNTSWRNVEKVIAALDGNNLLKPDKLNEINTSKLARLIRPAGYYNQKAKKLKSFLNYFGYYDFDLDKMMRVDKSKLRPELLDVWGIGPETADAILLYALDKPVFVVDAYTRRAFSRIGLVDKRIGYEDLRNFFESRMNKDLETFKEFHALIDELAKRYCKPKPECPNCPLNSACTFYLKNH